MKPKTKTFMTLKNDEKEPDQLRRDLLKYGLAGLLGGIVPLIPDQANAFWASSHRLILRNSHTHEVFSGVYRVGNRYLPDAFERINHVLRDHRTGDIFPMDPRVIDLVNTIHAKTGAEEPLQIVSGYRSPKTNAMLRQGSSGVAKKSLHMYGQAIDLRIPGFSTIQIRDIARKLKAGGVGYYPGSDFVHVDTGKVRSW